MELTLFLTYVLVASLFVWSIMQQIHLKKIQSELDALKRSINVQIRDMRLDVYRHTREISNISLIARTEVAAAFAKREEANKGLTSFTDVEKALLASEARLASFITALSAETRASKKKK